jgi:hypothetical protein
MNCKPDLETSLAPSEAKEPYRRPLAAVVSQHPADRSAAVVTCRDLRAKGLAPTEAGNLTAYLRGLRPVGTGWTAAEIGRLLFLRFRLDRCRIDS